MRFILSFVFALTLATVTPAFASEAPLVSTQETDQTAVMHNDEGVKAYMAGDYAGAEAHFREAIANDQTFAEAHFNLGLSLDAQGKLHRASKEFKTAKQLAPNNLAIYDSKAAGYSIDMDLSDNSLGLIKGQNP
jgi:Flp pilus assembly protein TadD